MDLDSICAWLDHALDTQDDDENIEDIQRLLDGLEAFKVRAQKAHSKASEALEIAEAETARAIRHSGDMAAITKRRPDDTGYAADAERAKATAREAVAVRDALRQCKDALAAALQHPTD